MPINATTPVTSRGAGYDLSFEAATLYVKPALVDGSGVANQAVAVADLATVEGDIRNALTTYQAATEAALEALRRGVPKAYAVAGVSATVAGIAAASVPTYESPVPEFADFILVTDPLDGGIYTRAGAIVHRAVADFPAGAQIYVDSTNKVYRVQDEPTADADGLTIGEITFIPFSDFNPQIGVDAIITTGSEVGLATGSEFSQTGRTLRFSQATNDLLGNLRADVDAEAAINATQNTRIGDTEAAIASHTNSISTLNGQVAIINSTALPGLQAGIDARVAKDATQDADLTALQGIATTHGQQLGSLVTITNQQAGQIAAVTAAEATLESEVDALTIVVASKDTAVLRDSAIAQSVELIKALHPVFALKAGDSQVARLFDSGKNETTFTVSGLPLLCKVDEVTDTNRRSVPIADKYLSADGTAASFILAGNIPYNDNWYVFLSSYKPVNFVLSSGNNGNNTQSLIPGSNILFDNGARFVVDTNGTYQMIRADGVQLWSDTVNWNSAKYRQDVGLVFADMDGTYNKTILSIDFFEDDQVISQAEYEAF